MRHDETAPAPHDTAATLSLMVVLVEDLLTLQIPPAEIRGRMLNGWLATHPSGDAIARHVEGLLAAAEGDAAGAVAALQAVLGEPDPCLAKPVICTLRVALAEALLGTGDRAGALLVVRGDGRLRRQAGTLCVRRTAPAADALLVRAARAADHVDRHAAPHREQCRRGRSRRNRR